MDDGLSPFSIVAQQQLFAQAHQQCLAKYYQEHGFCSSRLLEAVRYTTGNDGKFVRPLLTLSMNQTVGGSQPAALQIGSALEILHTYSLIHDDLPAMDDDALRRGQPTCHIVFDEATAILTGDALQALAFDVLIDQTYLCDAVKVVLTQQFSHAALAMVNGQMLDMQATGQQHNATQLEFMHSHKTGALITFALVAGVYCAERMPDTHVVTTVRQLGKLVGYGFQIVDDLLDVIGNQAALGKTVGQDQLHAKATYPSIHGIQATKEKIKQLRSTAQQQLSANGWEASPVATVIDYIFSRSS